MKKKGSILLTLMVLVFTVCQLTVDANDGVTNVNGVSEGNIKVTGNLFPEESEPPKVIDDKDNKKEPVKIVDTQKVTDANQHLPKTGEILNDFYPMIIGPCIFLLGLLLLLLKKNNRREI